MTTTATTNSKEEVFIKDIEFLSNHHEDHLPTRSIDQRNILERRWKALKLIWLGITNDEANKVGLELIDRLMDICNSAHRNDKDEWLLGKLAEIVSKYEDKRFS